jgi:starch phosphorylase
MDNKDAIAYFTMEIGLTDAMPTYAGGLGILAGDTVRSAADLGTPMVVLTLLHRKGYFRQKLDNSGWQSEEDVTWPVAELLQEMQPRCMIEIEGRQVQLRAWKFEVKGASGYIVPVFFLDTDIEQNAEQDRAITDHLYGGDQHYRLCQEAVLGIGGVRMLRALGYVEIHRFHMNEGHAALLTLELAYELSKQAWDLAYEPVQHKVRPELQQLVKAKCIFTTHTSVPAGHDKHIVNVSAVEGQFYRKFKTTRHPHTNMAKAALNMMTRTSAADYQADGIHMNAVDTGWVTDEDPAAIAARKVVDHRFHPPLDIVDGAARIVDPIIDGMKTGNHSWGQFLKDYKPTEW